MLDKIDLVWYNAYMENVPKIGRIYHVVDKTTGEVVKVGSTIRPICKRWNTYNKNKYNNHFLKEVRIIKSSEFDLYDKNDPYCPFLWHLVAAEHLEILRMGTFNKGSLSNKISPLTQKASGFDGSVAGRIGGTAAGITNTASGRVRTMWSLESSIKSGLAAVERGDGIHALTFEQRREAGIKGGNIVGKKHVDSGWAKMLGNTYGPTNGKKLVDDGFCSVAGKIGGKVSFEKGVGVFGMTKEYRHESSVKGGETSGLNNVKNGHAFSLPHIRWHVKRGIVSPICKFCKS